MIKVIGTPIYSRTTYNIVVDFHGEEMRIRGQNSSVYNSYSDYTYATKEELIIAHHYELLDSIEEEKLERAIKAQNRREAYAEKKKLEEIKTLAKELKFSRPELSYEERMDLAAAELFERNRKISWKYLNGLPSEKIRSIRYQKLEKKFLRFVKPLNSKYRTLKEFYSDFRLKFNWSSVGLSNSEWSYCRILKGNMALVGNHNRVLSYNNFSREGFIFDAFDVLSILFNMSLDDILDLLNIKISEYETFRTEQRHYKTILRTLDLIGDIKDIKRLALIDVYRVLITKGLEKMNSKNFKNDKAVFFYSITAILKELGLQETKSNISKIGNKINLLVTLGLINKVFRTELPQSLIFENGKGYDNNYFIVPELDFKLIKEKAAILRENQVGAHNISFRVISEVFTIDFAKTIFNQLKEKTVKAIQDIKKVGKELYRLFIKEATTMSGHIDKQLINDLVNNVATKEELETFLKDVDDDDCCF